MLKTIHNGPYKVLANLFLKSLFSILPTNIFEYALQQTLYLFLYSIYILLFSILINPTIA